MPDFSVRDTTPELMDTEVVTFEDFRECLQQLARDNAVMLGHRPTIAYLERLRRQGRFERNEPVRIVDIGSGYGDMLREIDRWADKRGVRVALEGVDINPWSARAAEEVTAPGRPITWVTQNLFDYEPPGGIDIVISSLFTHHLHDPMLVRFVAWMEERARMAWLINDLHRHRVPYTAVKLGFRVLRRHRFMQHDGPVSFASAFRRADWERTLASAGVPRERVSIEWWMPFRWRVTRLKGLTA
jgi:SAM-dependent methyltransferase